ncbi:acyl-CoA thioesterase domain-containing protein [Streptomyces sp. NPDC054904]
MDAADGFYERVDAGRFRAGEATRGPWDVGSQHAGPPAALLGRAVEERPGGRTDMRIARITYEILRPVPIGGLEITTSVLRSGRGTEVVEAALVPEGADAPVMLARRCGSGSPPSRCPRWPRPRCCRRRGRWR